MTGSLRAFASTLFGAVLPIVILAAVLVMVVSPAAFAQFVHLMSGQALAEATSRDCVLVRDGSQRQHAVRCALRYRVHDQTYTRDALVWQTSSPFATAAGLHQALAQQQTIHLRSVSYPEKRPGIITVMDERLLAMPGTGVVLFALVAGLFALACWGVPSTRMHRREDYVRDPVSDRLVHVRERADAHSHRVRLYASLWLTVIAFAAFVSLYGISDRLQNEITRLGFTELRPQPVRLRDCASRYYGVRKGHHQIECQFHYQANGEILVGEAESLDFRFFSTRSRRDAQVALLEGREVMAWVDPRYPTYAWASMERAWFVPYTFGLMEWIYLVFLVGVAPIACVVLWRRARALSDTDTDTDDAALR